MSSRKLLPKFQVDLDKATEKRKIPITQFYSDMKSKLKNKKRNPISKLIVKQKQGKL